MDSSSIILIISTFLITSALFILYYFFVIKKRSYTMAFAPKDSRISLRQAQTFMKEYSQYKPLRVTHAGANGHDTAKTESLEGFIFQACDLLEIIQNNHGKHPTADKVIFLFGQNGKTNSTTDMEEHGNINIIAMGMQGGELLDCSRPGGGDPSIFDHADPCPPYGITESL